MFRLDDGLKVYLHREAVDFRKNINGLATLVEQSLGLDPFARAFPGEKGAVGQGLDTILPQRAVETPPRPRAKSASHDDPVGPPASLWGRAFSRASAASGFDGIRRPA